MSFFFSLRKRSGLLPSSSMRVGGKSYLQVFGMFSVELDVGEENSLGDILPACTQGEDLLPSSHMLEEKELRRESSAGNCFKRAPSCLIQGGFFDLSSSRGNSPTKRGEVFSPSSSVWGSHERGIFFPGRKERRWTTYFGPEKL